MCIDGGTKEQSIRLDFGPSGSLELSKVHQLKRTMSHPESVKRVRPLQVTIPNSKAGSSVILKPVTSTNLNSSSTTTGTQTSPMDTLQGSLLQAVAQKLGPIASAISISQGSGKVIRIIQTSPRATTDQAEARRKEEEKKRQRLAEEAARREWEARARASVPASMRDSVLLNLLIAGEDQTSGYSCGGKVRTLLT